MRFSFLHWVLVATSISLVTSCPTPHKSKGHKHLSKATGHSKSVAAAKQHHKQQKHHTAQKKMGKHSSHKSNSHKSKQHHKTTAHKGKKTSPKTKGASESVGSSDFDKQNNFLGFSYDITACQGSSQLETDWANMKKMGARNTRLYGFCDQSGYLTKVLDVSKKYEMGLIPLVWFGFDGGDQWKTRAANIVSAIKSFSGAEDIVRGVAFGDEPLLDMPLSVSDLASQVTSMADELKSLSIPVATSDMAYSYQSNGNAPAVFKANEVLYAHALPFFDNNAQSGGSAEAWQSVEATVSYFQKYGGQSKKLTITQTGWPSNEDVWKPNNPSAVASVSSEAAFYDQLWKNCKFFTDNNIGWFASIYSDDMLGGWGVTEDGKDKFSWKIVTSC